MYADLSYIEQDWDTLVMAPGHSKAVNGLLMTAALANTLPGAVPIKVPVKDDADRDRFSDFFFEDITPFMRLGKELGMTVIDGVWTLRHGRNLEKRVAEVEQAIKRCFPSEPTPSP